MLRSLRLLFILALTALSLPLTALAAVTPTAAIGNDFDYFGALPWELPEDAVEMRVDRVHDGDSIYLTKPNDTWWEYYRIVGIQAPEIEGYKPQECYGPESADFVKALLPKGRAVWIQQDISNQDVNGRYLRHVFIQDERTGDYYLLSEVLVLGGYAKARSYPPDDLYDDVLAEAQTIARDDQRGLWGACD